MVGLRENVLKNLLLLPRPRARIDL